MLDLGAKEMNHIRVASPPCQPSPEPWSHHLVHTVHTAPRLVSLYKQYGDPERCPSSALEGQPHTLESLEKTACKLPEKPCKSPVARGKPGAALKSV